MTDPSTYNVSYAQNTTGWQGNFTAYSNYWYNFSLKNATFSENVSSLGTIFANILKVNRNITALGNISARGLFATKNSTFLENISVAGTIFAENATFGYINMSTGNITAVRAILFQNTSEESYHGFWMSGGSTIYTSAGFQAVGSMRADGDLYTSGSGDDLWIGGTTQASAKFRAYSTGTVYMNNLTMNDSNIRIRDIDGTLVSEFNNTGDMNVSHALIKNITLTTGNANSQYISSNATCTIIGGSTSTLYVC
jgi:hypothetical protein